MNSPNDKVICLSWEEWKAGREAKRKALAKANLDAPSRRPFGHDNRLRAAFNGQRAPISQEEASLSKSPCSGRGRKARCGTSPPWLQPAAPDSSR